ncbi:MAG TPA: alpha/beta hydrolase, partial [Herpetosiphonaceae bacterium]|nr:alpha/beta hydrolase [Herpetosiphonaceae bacterium]
TYPDVPGAILLEDPPARWMPGSERSPSNPEWQARMRTQITEFKRKTREELIAEQRAKTPGWSEAELGPWADSKLRLSPNVINRSGAAEVDWQALLRRITCPALLITADPAQGAIVSEESATALRELVPQLRVAHVPGAGHSIRRDQFGRYIEIVRAFLAEVTAKAA